jgi:hypothetical protein
MVQHLHAVATQPVCKAAMRLHHYNVANTTTKQDMESLQTTWHRNSRSPFNCLAERPRSFERQHNYVCNFCHRSAPVEGIACRDMPSQNELTAGLTTLEGWLTQCRLLRYASANQPVIFHRGVYVLQTLWQQRHARL